MSMNVITLPRFIRFYHLWVFLLQKGVPKKKSVILLLHVLYELQVRLNQQKI